MTETVITERDITKMCDQLDHSMGAYIMSQVWKVMMEDFNGWISFYFETVGYLKMFGFVLGIPDSYDF